MMEREVKESHPLRKKSPGSRRRRKNVNVKKKSYSKNKGKKKRREREKRLNNWMVNSRMNRKKNLSLSNSLERITSNTKNL